VLWAGEWLSFLSSIEFVKYVFFEEEGVGDWACSDRVSDGGHGVLGYGAAVASQSWVCVDDEEPGIHPIRVLGVL
jgi:hypothetical protein